MTVYLFGLDGASLDNLGNAMGKVKLPNFEKLLNEGRAADLLSVQPYVTAPAWTTMFTGLNPGKHGIFDLVEIKGGKLSVPNMNRLEVPTLWDYLSWGGKRVLVVGMPFIYPAPEINGVFVTGRLVPSLSSSPPEMLNKFDLSGFSPELDFSRLGRLISGKPKPGASEAAALPSVLLRSLEARMMVTLSLVESEKWDVVLIVDSMPDQLFHLRWSDDDLTGKMFLIIDKWLGELVKRMEPSDTLLVLSDHGFGPATGVFYLNEWLRAKHYVVVEEPLSERLARMKVARRVIKSVRRIRGRRGDKADRPISGHTDHEFSYLSPAPGSRVEAKGVAASAWIRFLRPDKALEETILQELKEVQNAGFLERVHRTTEIYSGAHVNEAPGQLLIEPAKGWSVDTVRITHGRVHKTLTKPAGCHRPKGLLIAMPDRLNLGRRDVNLCDITPTILQLQGLPIPTNLDGVSLAQT